MFNTKYGTSTIAVVEIPKCILPNISKITMHLQNKTQAE